MRLMVLFVAGCWTGGSTEIPKVTGCQIDERVIMPAGRAQLSLRSQQFADLDGPFVKLEVHVTGGEAHARVETEQVVLEGSLALEALPVRPKQLALHDGWLEVSRAKGRAAIDSALRLEVELPVGFQPSWTSIDLPCDSLTFAAPKEPVELDTVLMLPAGTSTTLFREPGARPIATWTAPKEGPDDPHEPLDAYELARAGNYIKIRIRGPNVVVAWVAAAAMTKSTDIYGGLLGNEAGESSRTIQCPHRVPIYVRIDNEVTRVGTTKPEASFLIGASRLGELEIQLGGTIKPFLKRKDLDRCNYP